MLHTRCAWCTGWAAGAAGSICPRCTGEILPLHDFGAARMLVDGGVDRYALGERVRGLGRAQHAALGATFDEQWAALQIRVDEARWVDRFLLTRRLAGEVEDYLIRLVPLGAETRAALTGGPRPPFDDAARLREVADHSPLDAIQRMATIALVHTRQATPRDEEATWALADHCEGAVGDEAALALGRWWVRHPRRDRPRVLERLRGLLADPALAPWAAVAASRWPADDAGRAALEPGLGSALASRAEDLRFAAALALVDEPTLVRVRAAADPDMRSRALRALAAAGSEAIAGDLAAGSDEVRDDILRGLEPPLGRVMFGALLAAFAGATPELQRDLVGFLRSRRFTQLIDDERAQLAGWIGGAALPPREILELVGWAIEPAEGFGRENDPRDDAEVRPFVDAAGAAMARATAEQRIELLRERRSDVSRWLFGAPPADAAPVVDAWARDPAVATRLLREIVLLHAHLNGWGRPGDDRALAHLFGVLDRAPTDEEVAASMAAALAAERGASGRDRIIAGLWQRFVDAPERRRALLIAAEPVRHELKERRRADGDRGPFAPAVDPARFFAVFAAADPLDAPALAREAAEAAEASGPPPAALVDAVIEHAAPRLAARPCTMLWALASVASPVANAFRDDPLRAGSAASVAALRRGWARLAPTMAALAPVDEQEARFAHLVDQIETELRLIAEAEERLAEDRRREEERRADRARRDAEEAERARQQRELEEHLRREREAAERETAAWIAGQRGPGLITEAITGTGPDTGDSPWDEPLLPDQPLPSLGAYARFLHAMSSGGDPLALLRKHEISPERWAACATAWAQLLSSRTDLALRFSQLYAALTAPRPG